MVRFLFASASPWFRIRTLCPWLLALAFLPCAAGAFAAPPPQAAPLAPLPPMGWNDWAHYQCGFNAQTITQNAALLVMSGLAARGYNTVTIDDCWMSRKRDAAGNLEPDPRRFPQGMKPVADAIHQLGLKFGIYEDAGYDTCGRYAGSGWPNGGGKDHFAQDAQLFASWGVDYLKLDGCLVYVPNGHNKVAAYRRAYAAESAALKRTGRPIVFSESAPAYFEYTPEWYDVLTWVRRYGQLWRESTDIANFDAKNPDAPRFASVLWNYGYNLPLGRFQSPSNWNDADFIIGGDGGISLAETRSQMALWSMMSAPLILSSDLMTMSTDAIVILGNRAVIAVDQDPLGRPATLIQRSAATDLLLKPLQDGTDAVALLNRGDAPVSIAISPAELGFAGSAACTLDAENLWTGESVPASSELHADIASHDTAIWRIRPAAACGAPMRQGAIVMTGVDQPHTLASYARCLSAAGFVEQCAGSPAELWTVTAQGALLSADRCLAAGGPAPTMQACNGGKAQQWKYTLAGNLVNLGDHRCLSAAGSAGESQSLSLAPCGHNQLNQIWSLPN